MKSLKLAPVALIAFFAGCASVQSGTANSVTIRHGALASFSDIEAEANKYCRGYRKTAVFKSKFSSNVSTFDCQ